MIEYFRYNQESHDSYNGFLIKWLPSKRDYPDLFKCCAPVAAIIFDNLHTTASCFYPSAKANLSSAEHTEQYISFFHLKDLFIAIYIRLLKKILIICQQSSLAAIKIRSIDSINNHSFHEDEIDIVLLPIIGGISLKNVEARKFAYRIISTTINRPLGIRVTFELFVLFKKWKHLSYSFYRFKKSPDQKLKRLNQRIVDSKLAQTAYIEMMKIKKVSTTGWFSPQSQIMFDVYNALNIHTEVMAHGHLSQPSLSWFYPVRANNMKTLTREEAKILSTMSSINTQNVQNAIQDREIVFSKNFLVGCENFIIAINTPDSLFIKQINESYRILVSIILSQGKNVYFRCHPKYEYDNAYLKMLSIGGEIKSKHISYSMMKTENFVILGTSSTFLIETARSGIPTYEVVDLQHNLSCKVKSLTEVSINTIKNQLSKQSNFQ